MPQWFINLEDTEEEHGPARSVSMPPEEAQQWLADLVERSRANKPPWWGQPQRNVDDDAVPSKGR
jgi:hypothetical protein